MSKRVLLAGIVGGIAMFLWAAVAHMVLPLGMTGIQEIPNEQAVLASMQTTLGGSRGLYMFPGLGLPPEATSQQRNAAMQQIEQKLAVNPSGLLMYHPAGAKAMTPGQLVTEFLAEVLEALLAVFLLAQTRLVSFGSRAGFVALAGLLAALPTNVSYWNWYGFPASYTTAYMTIQIVGFVLVGIVAAAVTRSRPLQTLTAAA